MDILDIGVVPESATLSKVKATAQREPFGQGAGLPTTKTAGPRTIRS
jgi:hypothetical protein